MQTEHEHWVGSSGAVRTPLPCLNPSQFCPASLHMPVPIQAIQRVKPASPDFVSFETCVAPATPLQELS